MIASPSHSYRFAANSRYRDVAVLTTTVDGQEIRYLDRRLLPDPSAMVAMRQREVAEGDRLDSIAAAEIGDPEMWWRVADANRAMNPDDLLTPAGRRLLIPMPLGVPEGAVFDAARLVLLIGPAIAPLPAPLPVMEAILGVEVTSGRDRSGFQLKLALGKTSPLQLAMLPLGFFDPIITRVVIAVVFKGLPKVLMDGIVTRQELQPGDKPGESALTLTGEDISVLMDLVELRFPYPAMPDAARVTTILARYAAFGVVPAVIPPPVINAETPTERFDTQNGTDRAYLQELAGQSGFVFFIEPGPLPGQSFGYFGPDYRLPIPQPALSVDMDSETSVESLSFSLDGTAKKTTVMLIYDPATRKVPVPIVVPDVNPLHPPLGARPTLASRVTFVEDTARLTPTEAAKRAFGIMMQSVDAVSGQGSLDVAAYGAIWSPRMLVGVRGAGVTYDGFYYVDSVTHSMKPGEYKQRFQISRDGMVSNTPVVVP